MKRLRALPLAALSAALLLNSCSLFRQSEKATGAPALTTEPPAEAAKPGETAASGEAVKTGTDGATATSTISDESAATPPQGQDPAGAATAAVSADRPATDAHADDTAATPTAEQQEAALRVLRGGDPPQPAPATLGNVPDQPAGSTVDSGPALPPPGGLRMGGIAPTEDPASSTDAPPHGANQVELHGLRSPKLPDKLPMDIDGKLQVKD